MGGALGMVGARPAATLVEGKGGLVTVPSHPHLHLLMGLHVMDPASAPSSHQACVA